MFGSPDRWPTPTGWLLCPFCMFQSPSRHSHFISPTDGCSRLVIYVLRTGPGISDFSKELLVASGIWKPRSGHQMCSLLLSSYCSKGPLTEWARNITTHTSVSIFLLKSLTLYQYLKLWPQTTGFVLVFSLSTLVTSFSNSERPSSCSSKHTHFFDQAPAWNQSLPAPPTHHADPSSYLPCSAGPACPPHRGLPCPFWALSPHRQKPCSTTLGDFRAELLRKGIRKGKQKERRGRGEGKWRGTWRRTGRANYFFFFLSFRFLAFRALNDTWLSQNLCLCGTDVLI